MDHTRHTPLQAAELNEATLIDAVIYGPADERIGTVSHELAFDREGRIKRTKQ